MKTAIDFYERGKLKEANAKKKEKKQILDEYVKLTGFARKYAIAKLNNCGYWSVLCSHIFSVFYHTDTHGIRLHHRQLCPSLVLPGQMHSPQLLSILRFLHWCPCTRNLRPDFPYIHSLLQRMNTARIHSHMLCLHKVPRFLHCSLSYYCTNL